MDLRHNITFVTSLSSLGTLFQTTSFSKIYGFFPNLEIQFFFPFTAYFAKPKKEAGKSLLKSTRKDNF